MAQEQNVNRPIKFDICHARKVVSDKEDLQLVFFFFVLKEELQAS